MSDNQIHQVGGFRAEEALASGTVTPGMLLERTTAVADTVKAHATEGGYAERAVSTEDALQGNVITDNYTAGELSFYYLELPGSVARVFLKAGENVAKNERLISAGDGSLIAEGSAGSGVTVKQIIGYADEALDLSGSGAVKTLLPVRFI